MAIAPNTTFVSGAVLTAAQQNAFGFGVVALASSSTSYTLTTSDTLATGMTVTFTAIASRNYKITYYEGQAESPAVAASSTSTRLHVSTTAGLQLQAGIVSGLTAAKNSSAISITAVVTFSAGSTTIIGSALCTVTTGTPLLNRSAFAPAYLLVEDIGPA